jgi:hypothetical protein
MPSASKTEDAPVPFWTHDPNVILDPRYALEFFPVETMEYNQKLNAVTRVVLAMTLLSLIFVSRTVRVPIVAAMTLGAIVALHTFKTSSAKSAAKGGARRREEGFSGPARAARAASGADADADAALTDAFAPGTSTNPLANVLVTDYTSDPGRKPAEPAYAESVNQNILTQAKKLVAERNPGQPGIEDKLFKNLGEQLGFEQSMRQFVSTPSTTIPNDQAAFADFCYGSMVSCKEGNMFACARQAARHTNS